VDEEPGCGRRQEGLVDDRMTGRPEADSDPGPLDLGNDVLALDTLMSGYAGITAGYLITGPRPCLVETGTANSAPRVAAALAAHGLGPTDLATIVVTHVHLDHAGGVGDLARAFPASEIVVHERGARHLIDPSRLMASAARVYGPDLDRLFGPLLPTEAERVRALGDADSIDLGGGRALRSHYSPGHAKHHVGLLDTLTGDLYVGDAAGVYVPDVDVVRPATPPPDFDLDAALGSLRLFADLAPTRLLFSHFGPVGHVDDVLDRSAAELRRWVEIVGDARAGGLDLDHAVAMVRERTVATQGALYARPDLDRKFDELSSIRADVAGIDRWLAKRAGEERTMGDAAPPTGAVD
jgi:glyoxylase-like metal-dependent hydrolase (beta-lactamase superfamily II)